MEEGCILPGITADNALCLAVRRVSFRSSPVQQVESLGQRDRVNRYTGGRKAAREEAIGCWLGGGVDRVPTLCDKGPARPPDPAIGDVNPVQGMSGRPKPRSIRDLMMKREIA